MTGAGDWSHGDERTVDGEEWDVSVLWTQGAWLGIPLEPIPQR
jgi:hypothetical protein